MWLHFHISTLYWPRRTKHELAPASQLASSLLRTGAAFRWGPEAVFDLGLAPYYGISHEESRAEVGVVA